MAKQVKYSEAALERARQRAITPEPKPQATTTRELDLERIKLPNGVEVPRLYYDLPQEDQKRLVELIQQQERKEEDDNLALGAVNQLLDLRVADSKRIKKLESMVGSFLPIIEAMQRQIDGINTSIEVKKSDEFTEQQVEIAQQTTNIQAIGAKEQIDHDRRMGEAQAQAADHQQRMAAAEEPVAQLEGRVKATMELAQEKGNATVDYVAGVESRVSKVDVRLQEVEGRVDVLGTPITRPEMVEVVKEIVSQEMPAQMPGFVKKELAILKNTGELGEGIEIDRAYLAQTVEANDDRARRYMTPLESEKRS